MTNILKILMKVTAVNSLKINDLKVDVNVWIQLVAEKQQQAINAHNPTGASIWTKKLSTLVSLKQVLDLGLMNDLESINIDKDSFVNPDLTASPFPKAFENAIRDGTSMVHVGVDPAKEDGDLTVISKSIPESEFKKHYIGEWKPDDQGFDRRKLRDAIVKTVNLSEPTATRIVTLNRGCSVKELVYMALEYRGRQLSSPRDQKHDAQWYANHHIATVLHRVEEIMMEGV